MPGRALPNTHTQRDKAFLSARNKYDNTPVAERLLTAAQYTTWLDPANPQSACSRWKKERDEAAGALSGQTGFADDLPTLERALRLGISHFIQNLNNAVARGALPASDRALFHLAVSGDAVPPLDSEADLLLWSERVAEGEADRIAAGGAALSWPGAAQVAAARAAYLALANPQSTAFDTARDEQQDVLVLMPATDVAIKMMWDTFEYQLGQQGLAGPALRSRARQWGVVYDASEGEGEDNGGTPPPPEPPALPGPPQNVGAQSGPTGSGTGTFTFDERPPEEEVTLYRVHDGAGDTPLAEVTSSPVPVEGLEPGETFSRSVSAVNAAGEGPRSEVATGTAG